MGSEDQQAEEEAGDQSEDQNRSHTRRHVTRDRAAAPSAPNVVTLRSVYRVEITGRTPDGRVIDRLTSIQNMSRSTRKANAASAASSPTPGVIDYDGVDRFLNEVDDDNMSTASSASSAQRTAEWQRRSQYPIPAPATAPPPHTPETAVFTRSQCRSSRPCDNQHCPIHDHLNPSGKKRRTANGAMLHGGDLGDEDSEDMNFESGVDVEEEVPAVPTSKSKRKTAASPGQAISPLRSNRSQPLAAFSEDDEDEPQTRKTIRRHHSVTYTNTNTRRLKAGEDPDCSSLLFDGTESNFEQVYKRALFYGRKLLKSKRIAVLAAFVSLTIAGLMLQPYPSTPGFLFRDQATYRPVHVDGDYLTKDSLDQLIENLKKQKTELDEQLQQLRDENTKLKGQMADLSAVLTRRLDETITRSDEEFANIRSTCCRSDSDIQRQITASLSVQSSVWEEKLSRLKEVVDRNAEHSSRSVKSSGTPVGDEEFDSRVMRLIWLHDADKLGRVDYAMESAGGTIISTRCSKTYKPSNEKLGVFGIKFFSTSKSPRTVIQPNVDPGNCWAFEGHEGYLLIKLSRKIIPTEFTYEHVQKRIVPGMDISSAPREFYVMGLHDEYSTDGDVLGRFEFKEDGASLQTFPVQADNVAAYEYIELRVFSNQGCPEYTCLYRFRVHGKEPAYK